MNSFNRRTLLKAGAIGSVAAAAPGLAFSAEPKASGASSSTAAAGGASASQDKDVTRILAAYLVKARYEDLPANVRREGCRTLMNWVGVAVGGSHHETVERAIVALKPFSGPEQAMRPASPRTRRTRSGPANRRHHRPDRQWWRRSFHGRYSADRRPQAGHPRTSLDPVAWESGPR